MLPLPSAGVQFVLVTNAACYQGPDLGNPTVVTIQVDDAEPMEQRGFCNQQIRDGRAMPHAMVVGQVLLELKRTIKNVGWGRNQREACVQE